MLTQITEIAERSRGTLVQDACGAIALVGLLIGCLCLPGLA